MQQGTIGVVAASAGVPEGDLRLGRYDMFPWATQGRLIEKLNLTMAERRAMFTSELAAFLQWIELMDMNIVVDQVRRTREEAIANAQADVGIANSLHVVGLAADLILYDAEWNWLKDSEDYEVLGDYWKLSHPLARWGGDFPKKDGGHFSHTWQGIK